MRQKIRHYLQVAAAWLLIIVGLILLVSPIPLGIFFIAPGLSLLIYSSETVQYKIHHYRERHPKINHPLVWVENILEHRLGFFTHALRKTRPDQTQHKAAVKK